ncbi:hypothetical protein EK904_012981 [Melospiza melodia maxima]|nr:hypothetical protein EK904_012981 [Melospiza melodia maxima]
MAMAACSPSPAAIATAFLSPTLRAPGSTGTPVFAECPDNDDERERRQRRRSRAVDSSLQGLGSPSLSTCIKLSTENVAAGTLDASAKIYAMRVDSVHADTFRVLGHLGKEPPPARDTDSPQDDSSPAPEAARKAQPKKKQSCKTIEQNLSNINVPEGSQRPEVDPMFQRAVASFDECSSAGIFLTGLRSRGCRSRLLSEHAFDPNLDPDSDEGEGWAPSQPEFLPESPASDHREFQPNGDSLGHSKSTGAALGEGDIGTMSLHVSLNPGEYSYFSPRVLSMWAGPEHWRFRPRQPPAPGLEKDSRQRVPRKVFELDFQEDIDFLAHFQKTKASTTLAKSILESQNSRSTTLPADFNYDPKSLGQLFLKPHVKLSPSLNPEGALDSEAGIEDYDYNNPNDTSNFCPALQVHKIPIQYARTAKRMDMRRLKRNMWELLTEQGEEEEEAREGTDVKVAGEKSLSDLIKDLRHRLPPTMATELSVPLAFVSLLHLANEKNLKLESTEELSDILVRGGD